MNPAYRLNTIVQFFNSVSPSEPMLAAWQRFLELEPSGSEEAALRGTQAVLAEIRSVQARLKKMGVPEDLFDEVASTLKHAFSPTQLGASWAGHKEAVTRRAVPLALQWASWSLSQFDETEIPEDSISSLRVGLAAQEQMLQQIDLPDGLREMLERQVAELQTALVLYKVSGVNPLIDAVNKQSGEMRNASPELVAEVENGPPEAKGAVQKGMQLIGLAAKVADNGSKIVKFGKELCELGTTGWKFGQQLLSMAAS